MSGARLVHLSDPHFGTVFPAVERALVRAVAACAADVVVLSGDITQRARRAQFREARAFVDALAPAPVLVVPGNHDLPLFHLPLRLLDPYRWYRHAFGARERSGVRAGKLRVVGVDSTSRWRHIQGALSPETVRAAFETERSGEEIRVLAVHHPLDCARSTDEHNIVRGAPAAVAALARAGVDVVLSGHVHDPYVTLSSARYPSVEPPLVFSVAGTCASFRTRRDVPNSFHVLDFRWGGEVALTVTRYDYDGVRFAPFAAPPHRFVRSGGSWARCPLVFAAGER